MGKIIRRSSPLLLLGVCTLLIVACETTARRIDPKGPETITSVNQLDIQDATDAAAELSKSLLESGVLGKDGRPSILAIDRYINNTGEQIDRDEVIKKIRVTLSKARVAQIITIGESGHASDEAERRA